ncbi:MAG: ribbon-helix-helix protein, CopG family [Chloroflexota bacterium]|nr:ribbon-helix-helix protein, CopG family [Chloroflexota bacterium]
MASEAAAGDRKRDTSTHSRAASVGESAESQAEMKRRVVEVAEIKAAADELRAAAAQKIAQQEKLAREQSGEETGRVKLTVNLPERDMATLRNIAARRDMSMTDVVRRAIAMEQFIEEVESEGGKLLVEQRDRSMRQLVLR